MNRPPLPAETGDHRIVQAQRRATVVRARFEHELAALLDELHELRETLHGHQLPYEPPPADRHEDTP